MTLKHILRLIIIAVIAPTIAAIGVRYIPGFSVTADQIATIILFLCGFSISAVKAKGYRTYYVRHQTNAIKKKR